MESISSSPVSGLMQGKYYRPGESPLENALNLFLFLDGVLAQLTTLDTLRLTNVSQMVRAHTYAHTPSFRVLNFVRFCQESHRFLPNRWPHNGTNELLNWKYDLPTGKYPYTDTNEWECAYKFRTCYGRFDDDGEEEGLLGFGGRFEQREYYYYNRLNSAGLRALFRRLLEEMQLTILIPDGTNVGMRFVKEIFKST